MSYKFVYVSLNKVPSIKGWYLIIEPDENIIKNICIRTGSVLEEVSDKWIQSYSQRYFGDKHTNMDDALNRVEYDEKRYGKVSDGALTSLFFSTISHPLVLDGMKRNNILKHLSNGRTILINRNGGYSFLEGYTVLCEEIRDEMIFPKDDAIIEKIFISRYPGCKHYYLSSSVGGRIFNNNAFFTKSSAREEALNYVDEKNIIEREDTFMYTRIGD